MCLLYQYFRIILCGQTVSSISREQIVLVSEVKLDEAYAQLNAIQDRA